MSTASFFEKLQARASTSLLCVGLDPRAKTASAARDECIKIVNSTLRFAAAYKPNAAFFEVFGSEGITALKAVIDHIHSASNATVPVILDAKRGDIASTADAYARSAFQHLGADAITLSPYMGFDSVAPFLSGKNSVAGAGQKGVFVLCKTSNKGSEDFQTLRLADGGGGNSKALFEAVAETTERWNSSAAGRNSIGLVVGATDPAAIKRVRAVSSSWFLVPGVGAQGGDLEQSLAAGLRRSDGAGMLINVSRGISGAADPAAAAETVCRQINDARAKVMQRQEGGGAEEPLHVALLRSQVVRFGSFKLKSGLMSPIYLDLRRLVSHPDVLRNVAKAYARVLETAIPGGHAAYDRLCGLPYAALPIATAVSLEVNKPLIYPRREAKSYGTKASIEPGDFKAGERIVIIDDLVTNGESKLEAIEKLQQAGLKVVGIVVLIDREQGATQFLGERGFNFKAVTNLTQLLGQWRQGNSISEEQYNKVVQFVKTQKKAPSLKRSKL